MWKNYNYTKIRDCLNIIYTNTIDLRHKANLTRKSDLEFGELSMEQTVNGYKELS